MDDVFVDQIWTNSDCNEFEGKTAHLLNRAAARKKICVMLTDAVDFKCIEKDWIVITDNFMPDQKWPLWPEYYGIFCYQPQYEYRSPRALFSCFINRACPFRQSWLYQFVRRGLLDHGLISYNLDYRGDDFGRPQSDIDRRKLFEIMYDRGNHIFSTEHVMLRDKVPIKTFHSDLEQTIIDSKISIIIETYFESTETIALSEKTFRNLLLPRPWMLFASPHAVAHLRRIGFDVMDYLVDHDYDQMSNPVDRQVAILNQLESWHNASFDEITIERMKQSCYHNYVLLRDFKQTLPEKIQQIINDIKKMPNELY